MKQQLAVFPFLIITIVNATAQKMDTIVNRAASAITNDGPWVGISIGVVKDGKTWIYNYGTTEKHKHLVPSSNTLYEIGSITKTFSGILLAHAALEGKVRLDDDIRKYLEGDYPNLVWQGKPIELIHLVNLTSALPNSLPDGPDEYKGMSADSMPYAYTKLHDAYSTALFFRDLHRVKLDTLPGSFPRHSNLAGQLLGFILENIYKTSYEQLLKKYILTPLGMDETYIAVPGNKLPLRAKGYNERGLIMPYITKDDPAAFGLKSSIADMTKYIRYQLDERDPAVKMTHQAGWGNPNYFALAFNWFMGKTFDGKTRIRNDGTTFGFTTYCLFFPELGFGVVLMTNECAPTSVIQNKLGDAADSIFLKNYYGADELGSDAFGFSSSIKTLLAVLEQKGFENSVDVVSELKKNDSGYDLSEPEVNAWAYTLLRKGKKEKALEIFKLNTTLYPESYNAYDSEAEAYEDNGDTANAIKNYKRSLELNPHNTNAAQHLKKLRPNGL